MKSYAPYLLYQVSRFGALTVNQMLRICEGKCGRSSLYRALGELVDGGFVYPIMNPATRTRAYYSTLNGRRYVFGREQGLTPGVRPPELDHTILSAETLLQLSHYEKVTGISTHFEISHEDIKRFCYERIPDGIIQLNQDNHRFELAVEVESSARNATRVTEVLERYWETFRRGYECSGLLIVSMSPAISTMYMKALERMSPELQSRVRILEGSGLHGIRPEAFGQRTQGLSRCLDLTRTSFLGEIQYSPVKTSVYLSQDAFSTHTQAIVGRKKISGGTL